MSKPEVMSAPFPRPLTWQDTAPSEGSQASRRLLSGSLIMLLGSGMVTLLNLAFNLSVARMLGPVRFGHAAALVTLLMLVSAVTLSFQLVCAKLVARNEIAEARAGIYSALLQRAWMMGLGLAACFVILSRPISVFLNLPSPWLVIALAAGIAFYIPLGVRRGGFQGTCSFLRLSGSLTLETGAKLLGAIVLIRLGAGALGVVAAISVSVLLAYFLPALPAELKQKGAPLPVSVGESLQAVVFFAGQVIINNVDILLVKHFFAPETAGLYAAAALVGRVVYFSSWSVVNGMFPVAAGNPQRGARAMLTLPLLLVGGITLVFVTVLLLIPDVVLRLLFGLGFHFNQQFKSLLVLYAAATGVYALSVVFIAYEMARRVGRNVWLQLVFSGFTVAGIGLFHATPYQVVMVQLTLMLGMLIVLSTSFIVRPAGLMQEGAR